MRPCISAPARALSITRFSLPCVVALFAACATWSPRPPAEVGSPAPVWLSQALGCRRQALDSEWKSRRYGSTSSTDTACVILGRWGRPTQVKIEKFVDTGPILVRMDWRDAATRQNATIYASRSDDPMRDSVHGYFKIVRQQYSPPQPPPDTSHTGSVVGVVFDSTGRPLPRPVTVCADAYNANGPIRNAASCTVTSTAGTFRLDSLRLGLVALQATCATSRSLGKAIWPTAYPTAGRIPGTAVVLLNTGGCDSRPVRTVTRTFRGHWRTGFEGSYFSPCPADSWRLDSDSVGTGGKLPEAVAWVDSMPMRATAQWRADTARTKSPDGYTYYSYVEWHATITGPGHYGHLGAAPFRMVVDSVITMRTPTARDCM